MLVDRFIMAFQEPCIETYPSAQLATRVSVLLRQSYIMSGFKVPDASDLAVLTAKLTSDLFESYRFMTYGEVALCFEFGVKGEYGDFMGLNIRTFCGWLRAYRTSELRYRQVVGREKQRQAALPPVSEAYNNLCRERMLQNAFLRYREGCPVDRLMPSRLYRLLQEQGLANDSPADKRAAMAEAERHRLPAGNLQMDEETRRQLVKMEAMAALLKRYFDRLVQDGAEKLPI